MKVCFVYDRLIYSKWFSPLIDEALARGHEVTCFLNHTDVSQTTKWYEFPDPQKLPALRNGAPRLELFKTADELRQLLSNEGPCVVFSMRPPKLTPPPKQIWAHLITSFFDSLIGMPPEELNRFDIILCNTAFWKDECLRYYSRTGRLSEYSPLWAEIQRKIFVTGSSQYDHFSLCDKAATRKKLGIPENKRVVTVYAFDTSATFWSQRIFHVPYLWERLIWVALLPFSYPYIFSSIGKEKFFCRLLKSIKDRPKLFHKAISDHSERDVLRRLKRFCDENGFFLLMKYRKKAPPRGFQAGFADLTIYEDTDYYPYSSAQIVSLSDLQVAFYSSSVAECAFAGTPVISLYPADDHDFFEDNYELLYRVGAKSLADGERETYYNNRAGGVFNYPGVVHGMKIQEFCNADNETLLKKMQVDSLARESYLKKFIQEKSGPRSAAILSVAEEALAKSGPPVSP